MSKYRKLKRDIERATTEAEWLASTWSSAVFDESVTGMVKIKAEELAQLLDVIDQAVEGLEQYNREHYCTNCGNNCQGNYAAGRALLMFRKWSERNGK